MNLYQYIAQGWSPRDCVDPKLPQCSSLSRFTLTDLQQPIEPDRSTTN